MIPQCECRGSQRIYETSGREFSGTDEMEILWEGTSGWKLHLKPLSESWHPGEAEQLIPGNKGNNPLTSDFVSLHSTLLRDCYQESGTLEKNAQKCLWCSFFMLSMWKQTAHGWLLWQLNQVVQPQNPENWWLFYSAVQPPPVIRLHTDCHLWLKSLGADKLCGISANLHGRTCYNHGCCPEG